MFIISRTSSSHLVMAVYMEERYAGRTDFVVDQVSPLGVAIIIPVAIMESGIEAMLLGIGSSPTNLFSTTTMAFVVAALPEETFKLFALWTHKMAKTKVLTLVKKDTDRLKA